MTHTCLNELLIEHPGVVASVMYFFLLVKKCKMYCLLKTPLYFHFSMYSTENVGYQDQILSFLIV